MQMMIMTVLLIVTDQVIHVLTKQPAVINENMILKNSDTMKFLLWSR